MTKVLNLFATTPKGLELLLVDELKNLGATDVAEKLAGVTFKGDLSLAYQACLWSRLANRILLFLAQVPAETPEDLYAGVQTILWNEHINEEGTFAVHFISSQSEITHTLFGAQKVKDAIVDQFREKFGVRPSVDRQQPEVSVYVYLHRNQASIYLDLSGESLHKRGYRLAAGVAPLKENLAAAILQRSQWPQLAKEGCALMDPMCGSGTLLIEGALIAGDIAPGLLHEYFGFLGWKKHEEEIWQKLITQAKERREQGMKAIPTMVGYDQDSDAIKTAFENIERADLRGKIHVEKRELSTFIPKPNVKPGLVVVNPPYGERLGEIEELKSLYSLLGNKLKEHFTGWKAAVFTGNPDLGKNMGLRAHHSYALFNGALPCKLLLFDVNAERFVDNSPEAENERRIKTAQREVAELDRTDLQMFINRVTKNLRHLKKQTKKQDSELLKIYDADIPEYPFSIVLSEESAQVEEYQAPKFFNAQKALQKRQLVLACLPELLNLPARNIYFKIVAKK